MKQGIGHALIVDDSRTLRDALLRVLAEVASSVSACESVCEARALLGVNVPDVIFLDFDLPDGNALDVLSELERVAPAPVVIAMSGIASPEEAFQLGTRGVCAYLHKPFDLASVSRLCNEIRDKRPDIRPFIRGLVGRAPMAAVESEVRATMVHEALSKAQESRRGAAKLLDISRQTLQHILRKREQTTPFLDGGLRPGGGQPWCATGAGARSRRWGGSGL